MRSIHVDTETSGDGTYVGNSRSFTFCRLTGSWRLWCLRRSRSSCLLWNSASSAAELLLELLLSASSLLELLSSTDSSLELLLLPSSEGSSSGVERRAPALRLPRRCSRRVRRGARAGGALLVTVGVVPVVMVVCIEHTAAVSCCRGATIVAVSVLLVPPRHHHVGLYQRPQKPSPTVRLLPPCLLFLLLLEAYSSLMCLPYAPLQLPA
ncbi:hypothetical protein PF003_g2227 [Phytophthora fragariae]|nr:hypothetical protein PF003_g2227 [Phytophthora fragariae]